VRGRISTEEANSMTDVRTDRPSSPVVLLGSARSGTTWLQDGLAQANALRTIFEPLHPEGDKRAESFAHAYLTPEDQSLGLSDFLSEAFTGSGLRLWRDLRVNPAHIYKLQSPIGYAAQAFYIYRGLRRYLPARNRPIITKMIRGNLLGGWLVARMRARTLLLVRHPCAVVSSQLRVNPSAWHDHHELLNRYLANERLVDEHLGKIREHLVRLSEPSDVHAALWCIENAIPCATAIEDGVGVAYYERLLANDHEEWSKVIDCLALDEIPSRRISSAPSQQAASDMKRSTFGTDRIGRWRDRLERNQIERIHAILARFEVENYSTDDPMPRG
jgi:hypothetical protein